MKINLILLVTAILIAMLYTYSTTKTPNKNVAKPPAKTATITNKNIVKNFTYTRLNGVQGQLHDHKGRTTLIHEWAVWCAPCLIELPKLIDLATAQKHIDILAISIDQDSATVNRFMKKIGKEIPKNFIIITDPKKDITQDIFQTIKLPETFILTPEHDIYEKFIGVYHDWNEAPMINKLNMLSNNPE